MITVLLHSNYLKIQIYNTETKVTLVVLAYSRTHTHTLRTFTDYPPRNVKRASRELARLLFSEHLDKGNKD